MDIDWFLMIGMAHLKLTPDQFWQMRIVHFFLLLHEHNSIEEIKHHAQMELVRLQTTELININLAEDKKIKPHELWEFEWDEPEKVPEIITDLTPEELNEREEQIFDMLRLKQ